MKRRFLKSIFSAIIAVMTAISYGVMTHAIADPIDEADPLKLMQNISDELIKGLQQHKSELKDNPKVIYDLVHTVIIPHVDTLAMTKLVLGRSGYQEWKQAPAAKQQQFQDLLTDLVIGTYVSALQSYDNEKAVVYPPREPVGDQKRVALNSKIFNPSGQPVNMVYVLNRDDNAWKIIDFSVEGVSLVQSYRSQFAPLLSEGGLDKVIATLQKHNQQNKTQ